MLAVLPEGHRLAGEEKIRLEELTAEPFILLEEGHFSEPLNAFLHSAGLEPDVKYRIHDDYAITDYGGGGAGGQHPGGIGAAAHLLPDCNIAVGAKGDEDSGCRV